MVDRINDNINKKDLELILEVNKKAIEIETAVVDQNEEIIDALSYIKKMQEENNGRLNKLIGEEIEKLMEQAEKTNREIFKMQVLFITGLLGLVVQIVQIFMKA